MTEPADNAPHAWETNIASFLAELSSVQSDLLALLSQKRELIAQRDATRLKEIEPEEAKLTARLTACHERRQGLLATAGAEGLPSDSLKSLTAALSREPRTKLTGEVQAAQRRSRLVQHQSLTNWVLVQRSLLHLSQMIEIIATGGEGKPTYGDNASAPRGGALVDQAV